MKAISKLKDDARRHEQREEWDKAIQVYLQVLEISEAGEVELPLYNRIGDLCVRLGRAHDAVRYYEEAADRYAEAGLYNNAIALCNKALRYQPQRLELLRKLGQFSASQGFLMDARRYFLEYAEKEFASQNVDAGIGALEDYVDVSDDVEARELLGRRLLAHGRTARATAALRQAYEARRASGDAEAAAALRAEIEALSPGAFSETAPQPAQRPADPPSQAVPGGRVDPLEDIGLEINTHPLEAAAPQETVDAEPAGITHFDPLEGLETEFEPPATEPARLEGLEATSLDFDAAAEGLDMQDLGIVREETSFDLPLLDEPARIEDVGTGVDDVDMARLDTEPFADLHTDGPGGFSVEPLPGLEAVQLPGFEADVAPLSEDAGDAAAADVPQLAAADLAGLTAETGMDADALEEFDMALPLLGGPDDDPLRDSFAGASPLASLDATVPLDEAATEDVSARIGEPRMEDAFSLDLPPLPAEEPVEPEPEESPSIELPQLPPEPVPDRAVSPEDEQYLAALLAEPDLADEPAAYEYDDAVADAEFEDVSAAGADDVAPLDTLSVPDAAEVALDVHFEVEDAAARDAAALEAADELAAEAAREPAPPDVVTGALEPPAAAEAVPPAVAGAEPPAAAGAEPHAADAAGAGAGDAVQEPTQHAEDYVDLAAMLAPQNADTTRFQMQETDPSGDEDRDFAELLSQFKAKVSEHVPVEDTAAHYDLGLAFKEMGLIDEAIAEFQIALRAEPMRLKVLEELGHCFLQKEQFNIAEKVLRRALHTKYEDELELLGVYYHLGRAYEGMGRRDEARDAYERVLGMDINFGDASARLERL